MLELEPNEQPLLDAVASGGVFDPSRLLELPEDQRKAPTPDSSQVRIRAAVIKSLLLGMPVRPQDLHNPSYNSIFTNLSIVGAIIAGDLDLRDVCGRECLCLPPLLMEYCRFEGRIRIDGSHFTRLSLKGGRFKFLDGEGCQIDGTLDLTNTASSDYSTDCKNPLFSNSLFHQPGNDNTPSKQNAEAPIINGHRLVASVIDFGGVF